MSLVVLCGLLASLTLPEPVVPPPLTPAEVELHWAAPEGCPSADEIRARYLEMLSGPPIGDGTMVVDAQVTRSGDDVWTLRLQTRFAGVHDERTLKAPTCGELGDATATLLAVALEPALDPTPQAEAVPADPGPTEPEPQPTIPSAPGRPPMADSPAGETPRPAPPPRRSAGPIGLVRPMVGLQYGALPGVTGHLGLAGGIAWPRARLELDVGWLSPRHVAGPDGTRARTQMLVVAGHGCLRARLEPIELPVCAGLEAGIVRAVPAPLPGGTPVTGPWLGPSIRVGVAYRWQRVGLWAAIGAVGRAWATRLQIAGVSAFRPELVSLRVSAGLEVFFGGRHGSARPRT